MRWQINNEFSFRFGQFKVPFNREELVPSQYQMAVERTLSLHEANKADHTDHLLSLMNLQIWCRMYLDGRSPDDVTAQLTGELVS